jgi:hypothetical protein
MNFPELLKELFAEGRVTVAQPAELTPDELRAAAEVLEERQRIGNAAAKNPVVLRRRRQSVQTTAAERGDYRNPAFDVRTPVGSRTFVR